MNDSDPSGDGPTSPQIILQGPVKTSGKQQMNLQLTSAGLTLVSDNTSSVQKNKGLELLWRDIITAQPGKKLKNDDAQNNFCIYYIQSQTNKKLQMKHADISSAGDPSADVWISTIQQQCASVKGRPKKLFVLVNPLGGSGSGRQIFEKRVQPIFEMAGIQTDVRVTEKAKHALELAENHDFSPYDGIVVVGGDGSYHEIIHGLTIQTQKSSGVDYNDSSATLKPLQIPIGVIPAGTGNGVAGWFNDGVIDVETSVLRVVRGERQKVTALSVHSGGKLFSMSGLLFGSGMFSDMIKRSDELRWMKRARYAYCLLGSMIGKRRNFHCNLEYQLAPDALEGDKRNSSSVDGVECSRDSSWIVHDGKDRVCNSVCAFIVNYIQRGERVLCDVFSNHISILVDHGCSTFRLLKYLLPMMMGKPANQLPDNLELINKVQAIRMKVTRDPDETDENVSADRAKARELENYLNVDGESQRMEVPEFEIRVIQSYVPIYGFRSPEL